MEFMIILVSVQIRQFQKSQIHQDAHFHKKTLTRTELLMILMYVQTPENYPVLADGCTDESAKEIDWDEDGYTGDDDEFMFEPTQWADSDGDGLWRQPRGVDGDQCPQVSGNSTEDRLGCLDTDSDGYSDPTGNFAASPSGLADAFIDDVTQWHDIDGDGYGDNSTGLNPDLCPTTNRYIVPQ